MTDSKDDDPNQEEDKVAAAYENISKKLESLRSGKNPDDSDDPKEQEESKDDMEEELEEWKGPKGKSEDDVEEEDEEDEIRKVRLKNLERVEEDLKVKDDDDSEDSKESGEPEDSDESKVNDGDKKEEVGQVDKEPKKNWKPKENDPLDEESESGESEKSEDSDESEILSSDAPISKKSDPSELDDLTEEGAASKISEDTDAIEEKEEDEYIIPNLKASRQTGSDMAYNTPTPRESYAQSLNPSKERFMEGNDPTNFFSQHQQERPVKRANKFHLLILVIIGIAVIGFTIYILKGGFGEISFTTTPSPSPSPVESPSPIPTPSPEPDRAKFKVRILNGSGKTGLAKTVSDKLKGLGYQIDKTGNATNSAFLQTVVRTKSSAESFIPQIVKDLSPEFDAAGNTSLKDSDTVDIEVILGAK